MSAAEGGASVERMREALAARVAATSLRQVAREVGMSPSGLQNVLDGADSYSRTRRKLERWYVRETARYRGALDPHAASAALHLLTRDLPPGRRRPTIERIIDALEEAYTAAGRPAPPWLGEVRSSLPL
jgi:hypothetical protein